MFDYYCQFRAGVSLPKFALVDEVLHQSHQDLHLRARMHHKDSSETANRHRDRVHDETAKDLQEKHDFVGRTLLRIEENVITGAGERSNRDVLINNDASSRQRHYRIVGQSAAIHERATQGEQSSSGAGFAQHYFPHVTDSYCFPVFFDVPQAASDIALVDKQITVLGDRHDRVQDWWHHFHLFARLIVDDRVIKNTRYHIAVENQVADDHEKNICDLLDRIWLSVG